MKFTVIWTCDDEFCTEKHGPSEIDKPTEEEAVKYISKQREVREVLGIEVLPCQLQYEERVLWKKPVHRF